MESRDFKSNHSTNCEKLDTLGAMQRIFSPISNTVNTQQSSLLFILSRVLAPDSLSGEVCRDLISQPSGLYSVTLE